jgi:hypothetical protein
MLVPSTAFGVKRREVRRRWRNCTLKNIVICNLRVCILYIIKDVGNRAGKRSLGKFMKVRENNIKIDVKNNSVRRYKQD